MGTVQVSDDKGSIEIVKNGSNTVEVNSQKPRSSVTVGVPHTSVVEKIDQGPAGPPNVLSIGTVTSGTSSVTITGTTPAQVLNFVLPIAGSYVHTQSAAASTWTINHNLGYYPAVSVVDSGESLVIGDVLYISTNTLSVSFTASFGGKAYLS